MNIILSYVLISLAVGGTLFAGIEPARSVDCSQKTRIIYTNDTQGYLEPCGCGGRYEGGLARRATAVHRLASDNQDIVVGGLGILFPKRTARSVQE